ncbi:P-selectin-like [Corticium candelabrum]|uniref:P-selectin-like n=1 Tax=Corticium candelabrum TaxID=121492 RepID=UPI002E268F7A|nr:P-selectin-like [Corticium candelabrum]
MLISGVATRTCNNGHWGGSNPNCILGKNVVNARKDLDGYVDVDLCFLPACTKPNNPSNGRVQIQLTYAQYTCNGGFKLIGSQKRQCVGSAWNGYAPWCAKSCSALSSPPLGTVKWNRLDHDATATYSCYPNYKISGVATRTCKNGVWNGRVPTCILACPRLVNPSNGLVVIRQTAERYSCNRGFQLIGPEIRHCSGQKWTSYAPWCEKLCPTNLDRPEHGLVTVSNNVATYTCFENYKIQGTETRQCSKGIWEEHPPQCVLECTTLTNPPNGKIELIGNIVYYKCLSGHKLVGNVERQCVNKVWSGSQPKCTKVCSTDVKAPEQGSVTVSDDTATYTCFENYKIQGAATRRCHNGKWEGNKPECVFKCRTLFPPPNGEIEVVGPNAYYDCLSGYTLVGNRIRECDNNEVWTGKEPRCEKDCEPLSHPEHGYNSVNITTRKATFACRSSYKLAGQNQIKCDREGKWNGKVPRCILSCPIYPLANGKYTLYDSAIVYSCDDGYQLIGDRFRLCFKQQWTGKTAVCIPKSDVISSSYPDGLDKVSFKDN